MSVPAAHCIDFGLMSAGGSFGKVYKAIDRSTGETVAIKHVSTAAFCDVIYMLTCLD